MPIYEYRCDSCDHQLEAFQKLSDDLLKNCPKCKTDSLIKKVSAAGFRLKGSGWYETDFKSGKKKNVSGAETGSSDSDSSNSGSKESSSSESSASSSSESGKDSSKKSTGSASNSDN